MTALILTIICSTSIALILKHNETKGGDPLVLLSGNYLVAALIWFGFVIVAENVQMSPESFIFGGFLGILFVFSFFSFAKAVGVAGTALATVSSRLSVVVPLVLSIIIFSEEPSTFQIIGFLFTFITVMLFYFSLHSGDYHHLKIKDYFYLAMVLVGIGVSDFCIKVFQQWRPQAEKSIFVFMIFLSSFLYTSIVIYWKKIPMKKKVFMRGAILGIPNVFSTVFLLLALAGLPAIVVFPVANIGIILLTTIGAMLIWKEKLNTTGIFALISGVLAIILLGF